MMTDWIPEAQWQEIKQLVPIVCVDVAIVYNGLILLIKRTQEPAKGEWWLPGGRLWKGEGLEACAVRKARQEVGLEGRILGLLHHQSTVFNTVHSINFCYLLKAGTGRLTTDGSWRDFEWVDNNYLKRESDKLHPYIRQCLGNVFYP